MDTKKINGVKREGTRCRVEYCNLELDPCCFLITDINFNTRKDRRWEGLVLVLIFIHYFLSYEWINRVHILSYPFSFLSAVWVFWWAFVSRVETSRIVARTILNTRLLQKFRIRSFIGSAVEYHTNGLVIITRDHLLDGGLRLLVGICVQSFSLEETEQRSVGTRSMYRFVRAGKEIVLHLRCCSLARDIIFEV